MHAEALLALADGLAVLFALRQVAHEAREHRRPRQRHPHDGQRPQGNSVPSARIAAISTRLPRHLAEPRRSG